MIEVYDENNKKLECEVLFTFDSNNKQFIVYMDDDDILASNYKVEDNKLIITPITSDLDYDIVDKYLEEWWRKND